MKVSTETHHKVFYFQNGKICKIFLLEQFFSKYYIDNDYKITISAYENKFILEPKKLKQIDKRWNKILKEDNFISLDEISS